MICFFANMSLYSVIPFSYLVFPCAWLTIKKFENTKKVNTTVVVKRRVDKKVIKSKKKKKDKKINNGPQNTTLYTENEN